MEGLAARSHAQLSIPADPSLRVLARVAVSAIASRLGFSIDEIDDLRMAVNELCGVCAAGHGSTSNIVLDCYWDDANLEVECRVDGIVDAAAVGEGPLSEDQLSRLILESLVDTFDIGEASDGTRAGHLRKTRTSRP